MKHTAIRRSARAQILQEANDYRERAGRSTAPLTARHIQHAVHICRKRFLVSDALLKEAGFRPKHYPGKSGVLRPQWEAELESTELWGLAS